MLKPVAEIIQGGLEATKRNDADMKERKAIGAHFEVGRVALLLDMSAKWVKERIKAGELEGFRLGGKVVVSVASLNSYLENRRMIPSEN